MTVTTTYPKRLIEVDLPIGRISAHARREKSIRHGHISTLHIWWARRPLAACRAVTCAALWPDPVDLVGWLQKGEEVAAGDTVIRPARFLEAAQQCMIDWGKRHLSRVSPESYPTFIKVQQGLTSFQDANELRRALLDFIADFANWDNSTDPSYLETARNLTQAAHEALGAEQGTRPIVVDPFAGGGSIPLEALRVGADAFASELNPVAVLLNKVVLQYVPKYGGRLANEIREWGKWIKEEAEKELAELYPLDKDGSTPIAYVWARTIRCEGPGCGAEVPLARSFVFSKRQGSAVGLRLEVAKKTKTISYKLTHSKSPETFSHGTLRRGSATCPVCGYTTPGERVRKQAADKQGGADSARLLVVYCDSPKGRFYREPDERDLRALMKARRVVEEYRGLTLSDGTPIVPDEELPYLRSIFNIKLIGVDRWDQMFSSRQLATLLTLTKLVRECFGKIKEEDAEFAIALVTILALAVDRQADYLSSICTWVQSGEFVGHTFAQGQSLPIKWDFAEVAPFASGSGNWEGAIGWIARVLEEVAAGNSQPGITEKASATEQPLPDGSAELVFTDPPYYDAVPYADLSDFFYVWLKRSIGPFHPGFFEQRTTQKDGEIVQLAERNPKYAFKTRAYFEDLMVKALTECRRVEAPSGLAVIVFAHKETTAWETMLQAVISAGWTAVASWPIDTERAGRLRAMDSAALASSVHLVCRPRENPDGSARAAEVGDWRDVLSELPHRIHEWMPRLAEEGVVGADAIFACLGPALEIFSRYSRVEKSSGEAVPLREYLEQVWAAVSKEALSMIFKDAETAGLEPDARLTAMWLWTLGGGAPAAAASAVDTGEEDADDEEGSKVARTTGFALEFDAARKIAQGLGVHLEKASSVVEIKGETARLLSVAERTKYLFGKEGDEETGMARRRKKEPAQRSLFAELEAAEQSAGTGSTKVSTPPPGATVLDQVHQAMILFAAGRGEAMKRFLVEESVGKSAAFWKLAQSLSALYPPGGDEKRWVDGVLARKKGLGL